MVYEAPPARGMTISNPAVLLQPHVIWSSSIAGGTGDSAAPTEKITEGRQLIAVADEYRRFIRKEKDASLIPEYLRFVDSLAYWSAGIAQPSSRRKALCDAGGDGPTIHPRTAPEEQEGRGKADSHALER